MSSVLDDYSDPAVTTTIERNNIDRLFIFAAESGGKTILREEGFTGVIGKPVRWPNYLVGTARSKAEWTDMYTTAEVQQGFLVMLSRWKLPPLLKFGSDTLAEALSENLRGQASRAQSGSWR